MIWKEKKIYFLILISLTILLIPFIASQFSLTNSKTYDNASKTLTIKNIGDTELATIKLESKQNEYIIDRGPGIKQKVAEFTINPSNFNITTADFIDDTKVEFFRNDIDGRKHPREFEFRYKVLVNNQSTPHQEQYTCVDSKDTYPENGTFIPNCFFNITDVYYQLDYDWLPLNQTNLLKTDENITIGLFTDVNPLETVEWVPTFLGVKVEEWATWSEALNTDLYGAYSLNASSGTLVDNMIGNSSRDGTTKNMEDSDWSSSSVIGNSLNFDGSNEHVTFAGYDSLTTNNEITVSFWFNATSSDFNIFGSVNAGALPKFAVYKFAGDGVIGVDIRDNTGGFIATITNTTLDDGNWHLVTFSMRRTDPGRLIHARMDGRNHTVSYSTDTDSGLDPITAELGFCAQIGDPGITSVTSGSVCDDPSSMDEVFFWTRMLSDQEALDLYNDGNGISYTTNFEPPAQTNWQTNSTNNTFAGELVRFSVNWSNAVNLSHYIFSWTNGSSTFVNDSTTPFPVGSCAIANTTCWSNVSKYVNVTAGSVVRWYVWANGTNGETNVTDTFNLTLNQKVSNNIANSVSTSTTSNSPSDYKRQIAESSSFSNTIKNVYDYFRNFADSVTESDTVNRISTFFRNTADSITESDTVNRISTFFRNLADAITSSFSITEFKNNVIKLTDSISSNASVREFTNTVIRIAQSIIINVQNLFTEWIEYLLPSPSGGSGPSLDSKPIDLAYINTTIPLWYSGYGNTLVIGVYNSTNDLIDPTSVKADLMNKIEHNFELNRITKGLYQVGVYIPDKDISEVDVNISVNDEGKMIYKTERIQIENAPFTTVFKERLKATMEDLDNKINANTSAFAVGVLIVLIIMFLIYILGTLNRKKLTLS